MAMLTLAEAAAATGVNRSTLFRAYKNGRMSATKTDSGALEVDPAELFRVFSPVAPQPVQTTSAPQLATPPDAPSNTLQTNALEVEVRMLREMLETMRNDRDAWREQAGKITAALPAPAPIVSKRPWWKRLAG